NEVVACLAAHFQFRAIGAISNPAKPWSLFLMVLVGAVMCCWGLTGHWSRERIVTSRSRCDAVMTPRRAANVRSTADEVKRNHRGECDQRCNQSQLGRIAARPFQGPFGGGRWSGSDRPIFQKPSQVFGQGQSARKALLRVFLQAFHAND